MFQRLIRAAAIFAGVTLAVSIAADGLSPKPQGAEVAFVAGIQKDLGARFATVADAEKAGYFRYTNEDDTGAISYANLHWTSSDPQHPSQLWYSAGGKFLGADFSVLKANSPSQPSLWGVNPKRWDDFGAHIHYVLSMNGKESYGSTSVAKFKAAGGDPDHPTADTIVKMGKATSASQVTHVFLFPSIWDLIVWVTPNPDGAFAEKNPLVKPSAGAKSDDSM
jgi:hypothetical protein